MLALALILACATPLPFEVVGHNALESSLAAKYGFPAEGGTPLVVLCPTDGDWCEEIQWRVTNGTLYPLDCDTPGRVEVWWLM